MRTDPVPGNGFPFLMGALGLVLLQGCLFGLFEEKQGANPDYRRFYVVTVAGSPGSLRYDSTYRINWTPINGPSGGSVSISLYQENRQICSLDSSAPNDGEYTWDLAKTKKALDYRLGIGGNFRVKVASVEDTGAWDYCPYFSIIRSFGGSLGFNTPGPGVQLRINTRFNIDWETSLDSATEFGIQLLKDTALAATVSASVTGKNSFVWSRVATSLGAGSGYRFRIFSVENPGIEAYSAHFIILPGYEGGFAITSPKEGDSLASGVTHNIKWTSTGQTGLQCGLGGPLRLDLAQDPELKPVY